jgi:hypothetical protein
MKHPITVAVALGVLSFASCNTPQDADAADVEVVSSITFINVSGMT